MENTDKDQLAETAGSCDHKLDNLPVILEYGKAEMNTSNTQCSKVFWK